MWAKWQGEAPIERMSLQTSIWEFSEEYLLTEGEASETEEILGFPESIVSHGEGKGVGG